MRVIGSARGFAEALDAERACGRKVGLVPTMGALHAGHRSLMERAVEECDVVAVTLFVNPLQFSDRVDLAAYPRDVEGDVHEAQAAGATIVFAPVVEEMYPRYPEPPSISVDVRGVSEGLEGASRPGHFRGVATVVAKLFALAGRCSAYFGEKDFQQLAVVRALTEDLGFPVQIVACPTVREADGLALSSRNARLSPAERRAASTLYKGVQVGRGALEGGERDLDVVRGLMRSVMEAEPLVDCDYAEVVDALTLRRPAVTAGELRLLVAATVGPVRLIDNDGVVVEPVVPTRRVVAAGTAAGTATGPGKER
ncbi:MAG: pantoate--beta-alanine ligase [Acidimicrobiales bacterium]